MGFVHDNVGLIKCRASSQADVFVYLYCLTSLIFDDPGTNLSTMALEKVVWCNALQHLTLTHTSFPDAGMLGCIATARTLKSIHRVGSQGVMRFF